jgi:hypothetical protein
MNAACRGQWQGMHAVTTSQCVQPQLCLHVNVHAQTLAKPMNAATVMCATFEMIASCVSACGVHWCVLPHHLAGCRPSRPNTGVVRVSQEVPGLH